MNPFNINTMPIDRADNLLYRESEVQQIKNHIESRKQTVIQGVEGVGKTSLLNCVFNREYRIQKALENTLISPVTEFPSDLKNDEIYLHFAEMVINSVDILSECGKENEMNTILQRCRDYREEGHPASIYFEKIMTYIYNTKGYRVVMVVDNFERFTSSKDVTMKHHETLRKLLSCIQYIVATNYDLNEDSLPHGVSGSFLLMNFAGNEIRIGGWNEKQTTEYLGNCLKDNEIVFSNALKEKIYNVTGGIPLLLNLTANYAYEYISSSKTEYGLSFDSLYNGDFVQKLLLHWCKIMNPLQIQAIKNLLKGTCDNAVDQTKLRSLHLRGLLEYKTSKDPFGNIKVSNSEYAFCCKYLTRFCKDEGKLENAASKNPLNDINKNDTYTDINSDISIETLIKLLNEKLENGNATREQLLNITKNLGAYLPDVTGTIDLNEELTDEILKGYLLTKETFDKFDPKVRDFLYTGIQFNRCFANVSRDDFDFSAVYLSFFKAVEAHLNLTVVPVMKKIAPDAINEKGKKLSELGDNAHFMMGNIYTLLDRRQPGIESNVSDAIMHYCRKKNITRYTSSKFWKDFQEDLLLIKTKRNDCPHTSILEDDQGKLFLQKIFRDCEASSKKGFVAICSDLYTDIMASLDTE